MSHLCGRLRHHACIHPRALACTACFMILHLRPSVLRSLLGQPGAKIDAHTWCDDEAPLASKLALTPFLLRPTAGKIKTKVYVCCESSYGKGFAAHARFLLVEVSGPGKHCPECSMAILYRSPLCCPSACPPFVAPLHRGFSPRLWSELHTVPRAKGRSCRPAPRALEASSGLAPLSGSAVLARVRDLSIRVTASESPFGATPVPI